MNLCSDGHDEVVYESIHCPVCEKQEELDDTIDEMKLQIVDLEEEIRLLMESKEQLEEIVEYAKENCPEAVI